MKWFRKLLREKPANPSKDSLCDINNTRFKSNSDSIKQQCYAKNENQLTTVGRLCVANVDANSCSLDRNDNSDANKSSKHSVNINKQKVEVSSHLREESNKLEILISHPNESISSTSSQKQSIEPDEFFDDPIDVDLYREEIKLLSEWTLINSYELEVERIQSCESFTDQEFLNLMKVEYNNDDESENEIEEDDEYSFVKIERTPSVISLGSYTEDEYGIFYATNEPVYKMPEASYCKPFDHDIQWGMVFKNSISAYEQIMEEHLCLPPSNPILKPKHPKTSSEVREEKVEALEKSLMGPLIKEIPQNLRKFKSVEFSIQNYFGLNDDGDIIINTDHIDEERGYGFLMRKSKKIYRRVEVGKAIEEDENESWYKLLKCFLLNLRDIIKGHPRNKTSSGGPGESVGAYALELANDPTSTFSRNIENFISCTKESREVAPQVVMRNMRQFMSGMKNYLVKHGEGDFQREVLRARSRLKSDEFLNLDTILEGVMHQLVVLPLREHLYGLFVDYYTRTEDIQLLVENVKYASARSAADFGIRPCVTPPSSAAMHQISLLLLRLQEAELPLDKLEILLAVVTAIFETTTHPRGQVLGADDFLPLLVFIVAKCGFIGAEIEAEFMWCLLQQSLLNGEAGYYLTALCSAVHVLKSFMASENEGTGSLDIRSSSLPACSSVLRVIIPDECNGSLQTRTLPVRPHTTTREVCRTIAHKARITNPQDYGLFKLVDGEETLLMDSECPQEARLEARGKHCMLAYKRIDAKIAWPTSTST